LGVRETAAKSSGWEEKGEFSRVRAVSKKGKVRQTGEWEGKRGKRT